MPTSPFSIELQLPPGLVADDTPFAAEGRWGAGNNVRFVEGLPETVGGSGFLVGGGSSHAALNGSVRSIFSTGGNIVIYGTANKLYWQTSILSNPTDITPATSTGLSYWAFASWGSALLAAPSNSGSALGLYTSTGSTATKITQAPAQITDILVTPQRQVLALGCSQEIGGVFNGLCIRGSDLEDNTSWTTLATNNAFEHILEGTLGTIVTGRLVGDYVAVWTTTGLFRGQYIGDPGQTYSFTHVDESGLGPRNREAVAVHEGVAYWMTGNLRLMRWAPGGLPQEIPNPIKSNIETARNMNGHFFVAANPKWNEIWIFYQNTSGVNDQYVGYFAYSIAESARAMAPVWFQGDLARTVMADITPAAAILLASSINSTMISGDASGNIYVEDWPAAGPDTSSIRSADRYLNSGRVRVMIRGVEPDFKKQTGNVSLNLYMKNRPQTAYVTKGPYVLAAGAAKKDFRASGMIAAVEFTAAGQAWRLGKPVFDCVTMGGR